jgi:hypothetical protein
VQGHVGPAAAGGGASVPVLAAPSANQVPQAKQKRAGRSRCCPHLGQSERDVCGCALPDRRCHDERADDVVEEGDEIFALADIGGRGVDDGDERRVPHGKPVADVDDLDPADIPSGSVADTFAQRPGGEPFDQQCGLPRALGGGHGPGERVQLLDLTTGLQARDRPQSHDQTGRKLEFALDDPDLRTEERPGRLGLLRSALEEVDDGVALGQVVGRPDQSGVDHGGDIGAQVGRGDRQLPPPRRHADLEVHPGGGGSRHHGRTDLSRRPRGGPRAGRPTWAPRRCPTAWSRPGPRWSYRCPDARWDCRGPWSLGR